MFNLVAHCTGLIYQEGKFLLPFITNVLISLWRSSWSNTELKVKFQPVLWNPCAWNQTTNNNKNHKNPPKNNPQSQNKNGRDMPNTYKSNSRCSLSFLKHHLCTFLPDKKRCLPSHLYFDLSWNHQVIITSIMKKMMCKLWNFSVSENRAACCWQYPVYMQGTGRGKKM